MKAVIATKYGPPEVLKMVEVDKPIPKINEVLIKIHATTVHIGDTKIRRLEPGMGKYKDMFFKPMMRLVLGFRGPRMKVLGMEFSGVIESIGQNVTKFQVGDKVFAGTSRSFGAYAEYITFPEDGVIAKKPSNISFGEAAAVPNGALTAMLVLKKATIQEGHKVLIYGASGSVGSFAVQLAKSEGAVVTAVCSKENMEMVKSLGADVVLDYTSTDFGLEDNTYQVIFDTVGKLPKPVAKKSLIEEGVYLNVLTSSDGIKLTSEDLEYLKELIEMGKLKVPVDRTYTFDQIVEAHRYVDQGHKKGNVVITVID